MSNETHVKGLAELQKFMDQLPPKLEANVMRGALRAGMNQVLPVAKAGVHSVSGELAKGLKVGTRLRGHTVTASIKAKGKHGPVAHLVEFGTAAHLIAAKARGGALAFLGVFREFIRHPGARPKPFMRPALDGQAQNAVIASAEYMKKRLATKEGLDTSAVLIEGDV